MKTQEFIDKWTDHPGQNRVMARDIEALVTDRIAALQAESDGLREALTNMLYIFDQGYDKADSLGQMRCNEARNLIQKQPQQENTNDATNPKSS